MSHKCDVLGYELETMHKRCKEIEALAGKKSEENAEMTAKMGAFNVESREKQRVIRIMEEEMQRLES